MKTTLICNKCNNKIEIDSPIQSAATYTFSDLIKMIIAVEKKGGSVNCTAGRLNRGCRIMDCITYICPTCTMKIHAKT